jgi:D-sedoheptulose 7-phosphate isomerase
LTQFSIVVTEHLHVIRALDAIHEAIQSASETLLATFQQGGKLLICGNGGSAADSQHIAAEFVVRYHQNRVALPAIALTTDTSILTAHPNDFDFATLFSRQIEALGQKGDCLLAISTSGNSSNILNAVDIARAKGMTTIGMTGHDGGQLKESTRQTIIVPSEVTARIQEAHILIAHWWCQRADEVFTKEVYDAEN